MLLPRLQPPLRAVINSIGRPGAGSSTTCLNDAFARLAIRSRRPGIVFVRHASHAQQGAVNKGKDGPGKRLGAKKSGEQYVIPGNIIFRQRGTKWFPGENVGMGRDHTIYATEHGFVKYYRDPARHKTRKYIGVVFERDEVLPYEPTAPRRRKLNMVAQKMEPTPDTIVRTDMVADADGVTVSAESNVTVVKPRGPKRTDVSMYKLRPGGMYRESNWEIGRAAEKAGVKVKKFVPGDRWAAWKKSKVRLAASKDKRELARKMKTAKGGKPKAKGRGQKG